MNRSGVAPRSFSDNLDAYVVLVETILQGILSAEGKAIWCARHLPRTYAFLQLSHRWGEMFAHHEEAG